MSGIELSDAEYRYFELVGEAIFTNPFAQESPALRELLGADLRFDEGDPGRPHAFASLVAPLEQRLAALAARGAGRLGDIAPAQRRVLRYAMLFVVYQRHLHALDALITEQRRLGEAPAPAPFVPALLAQLEALGFGAAEAVRYLELFYQLRRAYYFISEALVGISPAMQRLRFALWSCVFTTDARNYEHYLWDRMEDFSVLLLGPTGTGKGAAAHALGRSGFIRFDRRSKRFAHGFEGMVITANLAAVPESLMESELFGHRKGAFTGAIASHQGLFERCPPHGVLLLDEIAEVAPTLQVKLLNVLQERRFTPVGSQESRHFSGRVVAATNQPIYAARREGRFRDDFYYRLCSVVIEIPSLRERLAETPDELDLLIGLLLTRVLGTSGAELAATLANQIRADLPADYAWPGNVRELEQAVRRRLLGRAYSGDPAVVREPPVHTDAFLQQVAAGSLDAPGLLAQYCAQLYARSQSYAEVARRTGLDRRTVSKYVAMAER